MIIIIGFDDYLHYYFLIFEDFDKNEKIMSYLNYYPIWWRAGISN
jgi:hypothetical protein